MNSPFAYSVRYQRRKTLALHVLEDGAVEVRAPRGLTRQYIQDWVQTRTTWVAEARERVSQRQRLRAAVLESEDGIDVRFLGQTLRVQLSAGRRPHVERDADQLRMTLPPPLELPRILQLLDRWYLEQARELFEARFDLGVAQFQRCFGAPAQLQGLGLPQGLRLPEGLKLRRMRRRWGSCSRSGMITLNRELIKLPLLLTDYVIAHELCHLLEFNHSRRFYSLLAALMPAWRECEAELRNY